MITIVKANVHYKLEELQIDAIYLEQVQSYKYLGSTVNSGNSIEEEMQYRITLGNKAYYANQFHFKSRLVSKKSKLKLLEHYKTNSNICLWGMGLERNHKKQVKGIWKESFKKDLWSYKRKKWYMENQNKWWIRWIRHKNVINHIKAQWLRTFGHLHQMPEDRMVKKYISGNRCQYDHKGDQRTDGKMT